MSDQTVTPASVRSRAVALRPWCAAAAAFCLIAFVVIGILLPDSDDGVSFHRGDQITFYGFGILLAAVWLLPVRPRLIADADGVRIRGIFGGFRTVPWALVRAVEFRPGWRWARLVLPADETISLYAVMRLDGARSVEVMRGLRALHTASRGTAPADGTPPADGVGGTGPLTPDR